MLCETLSSTPVVQDVESIECGVQRKHEDQTDDVAVNKMFTASAQERATSPTFIWSNSRTINNQRRQIFTAGEPAFWRMEYVCTAGNIARGHRH